MIMRDMNNIPENDADRLLAKQFGQIVKGEKSPSEVNDAMLKTLFKARDVEQQSEAAIPVRGQQEVWKRIHRSITTPAEQSHATIWKLPSNPGWYWAAAAAIIVMIVSSILLLRPPGSQLIAEAGSMLSIIELNDGSMVTLRPHSQLYALTLSESNHDYTLSGEALFNVESSPDRIFTVQAGSGKVTVTGTKFNLNDRDRRTSVYLIEGEVIFGLKEGDKSVRLQPGEAAVIDRSNRLMEPFEFEPDEVTAWTQNRLIFKERKVGSILDELEFHFNIEIKAPQTTREELLGGSIPLDNTEQSLQDLGTVLGGQFVRMGKSTYQFIAKP